MWTLIGLIALWYYGRAALRAYRDHRARKDAARMFAVGAGLTEFRRK